MDAKEALSSIAFSMHYRCKPKYVYESEEKSFDIIEKSLNAFEIIKEKEVNVHDFKGACSKLSYLQYFLMWKDGGFFGISMSSKEMLTEEEYILLKEVLM